MSEEINKTLEGAEGWHPVEDMDEAKAGAYAEKPIRDAVHEYKQQLKEKYGDEDAQKTIDAMEWMASKDGEKAMAAYREEKDKEDPRVRLLREKAQESIRLTEYLYSPDDEIVEAQLKKIGMMKVERILATPDKELGMQKGMQKKLERIQTLGNILNSGIKLSATHERPKDVMEGYCKRFGKGYWLSEDTAVLLEGRMVADIAMGKGRRGVETLECIAELEGKPVDETVKDYLGFIVGARKEVETSSAVRLIDDGMEDLGWMWDDKTRTYISLEGEK